MAACRVWAMSISSQPPTRLTSLQRSRSNLLGPAAFDAILEPKASDTCTLQQWLQADPSEAKPHFKNSQPSCDSNAVSLAKQGSGLLPALASKIAEQLQSRRDEAHTSGNLSSCISQLAEQSCTLPQPDLQAQAEQQSAVSNSLGVANAFAAATAAATADAAQLTAELAAFKAGQGVALDAARWAASAKQTAQKVCIYNPSFLCHIACFANSVTKHRHWSMVSGYHFQLARCNGFLC